jgi:hypothetical protein
MGGNPGSKEGPPEGPNDPASLKRPVSDPPIDVIYMRKRKREK